MSKQVINNLESTGTIRDKLNDNFTELYDTVATKVTQVAGYALSKNDLSDTLKGHYDDAYTHISTSHADLSKMKFTAEGGLAVLMVNKTGSNSVKGTVVSAYSATAIDEAVAVTLGSADGFLGVIYENAIADGSDVWVVIHGIADVLFKDTEAAVLGEWAVMSATAGRVEGTGTWAANVLGPVVEAAIAGTDVLAKVCLK